jgi:hypothetical protein
MIVQGNVGIGTASPAWMLEVNKNTASGSFGAYPAISVNNPNAAGFSAYYFFSGGTNKGGFEYSNSSNNLLIYGNGEERMRITSDGFARLSASSGGIQFNGDTAAANALDDYEEGTWTMGVSFDGASAGVTYSSNTGTYTKIGRQVTVNGYIELTSKGSSTGSAIITGLPFAIANNNANYSSASLRLDRITFANQFQGRATIGTTTIALQEITILGVVSPLNNDDFQNDSNLMVNLTYFV